VVSGILNLGDLFIDYYHLFRVISEIRGYFVCSMLILSEIEEKKGRIMQKTGEKE